MRYQPKRDQFVTPNTYDDMNGHVKTFTHVDHDVKTSVSLPNGDFDPDWQSKWRADVFERITAIPAAFCPEPFWDFTIRGDTVSKVEWDQVMLKDEGLDWLKLRSLIAWLTNIMASRGLTH